MKNYQILCIFMISFALNVYFVSAHGGEDHNTNTDSNGLSLSLEQIYVITLIAAVVTAFTLEKRGIIKDRYLVYKFIALGIFFLTLDFVIYQEYIA